MDFEIIGDGIYPAVSLQTVGDQFKVKNFYPETNQLWDLIERQKEEKLMVGVYLLLHFLAILKYMPGFLDT